MNLAMKPMNADPRFSARRFVPKLRAAVAPVLALVRLAPLLLRVRTDPELRSIQRSYLGWMPLCLFSEPGRWLRLVAASPRRFGHPAQRPHSFYAPHLNGFPFRRPDSISMFLEQSFAEIAAEFARVAHLQVIAPSAVLVDAGAWNTYPLMRSGQRSDEHIAHCPATWAAAKRCPLPEGVRGGVYFSIMSPGTRVHPHCGPSNLKLRYHLCIEEAHGARIRSGHEWRSWHRGECLILDDSFEHEVVHDGETRRVVLIVDCWHPDLSEKERDFLARVHGTWRTSA